ncbi:MAG TPA: F0F1 ATP synthase subunit A [Thermoanaerobaculia bacterium]|jgi:F-type H+-transporting ATPase subunit a|nr:F0F1 ATP synthase subunit A [Thermoanaerobaculia bacterium]
MLIAFLAENPLEHIVRHPMIQRPAHLGWLTQGDKITLLDSHIVMMMLAALLLILLVPLSVRRRRGTGEVDSLVPTGSGNAVEAICEYLRKEVAQPALQQYTDRFIKFVWTVFFFVATVNLLGLLPLGSIRILGAHIGGTATANPWITGSLALMTLVLMIFNGVRLGGRHFFGHFNPGPWWLAWLLVPIEVIGLVARIFALIVRLCANMVAGHVLLAVLLSFIFSAAANSIASGLGVAVPVVLGSIAIMMLEIFVAFLQAFIFTFLTTLFIGQSIVFHHHDGHGEHAAGAQAH